VTELISRLINRADKWFFPALIILWSLLVHLPGLTSPLLDYHAHRQCQTASMARNYVRHGMHFLNPEVDNYGFPKRAGTEFPLYSFILALLFKTFGVREVLGRLLSIVLTAWSAYLLYAWMRRRLDERTAFWSAIIMCTIPVHVYFTRTVQPESMALWALLGFGLCFDRWLENGRLNWWVGAMALGALGSMLKLPFLYLVGGLAVLMTWHARARRYWVPAAGLLVAVVTLAKAWYLYAQSAPNQVLPLDIAGQLANLRPVLTWDLYRLDFISRFPEVCATYAGLVLGGIGAWRLKREGRLSFWAGWWVLTAIYTVLLGQYGVTHRYTQIPWAPINAIFIAYGFLWLWDGGGCRNAASPAGRLAGRCRIAALILLIGIPIHTLLRIHQWYRIERTYLFRAHDELARRGKPDDLILTNTSEHPVLLYYLDRYGFAMPFEQSTPGQVDQTLARGVRFVLTPKEPRWTDHPEWQAFLEKRGSRVVDDPEYQLYEIPVH
jgi:hypothetical protein